MISNNNKLRVLNFYTSPLGKKIITGITGIGLTLFILIHVSDNLVLFISSEAYNQLAHRFNSFGIFLNLIELLLLGFIIVHAVIGIGIYINKHQARPIKYDQYLSLGQPSKQSLGSRTMIFTGLLILIFLIFHLLNFKFGTYYTTVINEVPMRDLARLVREKFHQPIYAFGYAGIMILLGFHLRHGIWSALQSLGTMNSRFSAFFYIFALLLASLIAIGFIILPIGIYYNLM